MNVMFWYKTICSTACQLVTKHVTIMLTIYFIAHLFPWNILKIIYALPSDIPSQNNYKMKITDNSSHISQMSFKQDDKRGITRFRSDSIYWKG